MSIKTQIIALIDNLKSTCQRAGLGNDGNEFKIITQLFLYKFLNDKFTSELKEFLIERDFISVEDTKTGEWFNVYSKLVEENNEELTDLEHYINPKTPYFTIDQIFNSVWSKMKMDNSDIYLDKVLVGISEYPRNQELFSTETSEKTKIQLFEPITIYVTDSNKRSEFARSIINDLSTFSFEEAFNEKYDFFADIFEYLLKDYNTAGGGKYAEYYTPHSIARIMARLLIGNDKDLKSVTCYDPSAGTGTLLMSLAHEIGEDRCTIYAQDISQRSNKLLKLNLIINSLSDSLKNIVQGNTLIHPYFKENDNTLKQFDFIVSNPPFNLDFSDIHEQLKSEKNRFWAGVPNKSKNMPIYLMFIQHVINSLKDTGKGAIVVPYGFQGSLPQVGKNIVKKLIDERIIYGIISMPPNVFATTGTNVSVLFLDKSHSNDKVILIDATKLGEEYKDGNNQRRRLREEEIGKIVDSFTYRKEEDMFSVNVTYEKIIENNYSLSPGQYFDVKIDYVEMTPEEFETKMQEYQNNLQELFAESNELQKTIIEQLNKINYHA